MHKCFRPACWQQYCSRLLLTVRQLSSCLTASSQVSDSSPTQCFADGPCFFCRQWLFILEGVPSVFLGILLAIFLPETPVASKWLTEEQKELFTQDVSHSPGTCLALTFVQVEMCCNCTTTLVVGRPGSGMALLTNS